MNSKASPPADKATNPNPTFSFQQLVQKERAWLDGHDSDSTPPTTPADFIVSKHGIAQEPWVCFTTRDTFGVALSGGGIRSATFNLGLLQALEQKGLLGNADYLSTVSGGGYAGGFLDAWRFHHSDTRASFPTQNLPAHEEKPLPIDTREPAAIRQLREFSRFLMPRLGLFHLETWTAIVTILGGLIPSLVAACAVLALGVYAWLFLGVALLYLPTLLGAVILTASTLLLVGWFERRAQRQNQTSASRSKTLRALAGTIAVGVTSMWLFFGLNYARPVTADFPDGIVGRLKSWASLIWENFHEWPAKWPLEPFETAAQGAPFAPALAWGGVVALLFVFRALSSRFAKPREDWSSAVDRALAVVLGLALAWSAMAGLWLGCKWLQEYAPSSLHAGGGIGAGAATTAGLFALVRNWLNKPNEETRASTLLRKVVEVLRPKIPQLLAAAAVLLMIAGVCLAIQVALSRGQWFAGPAIALSIVGLTAWLFDPARMGMHDFYRARICRAFLGSARAKPDEAARGADERPEDEITLKQLRSVPARPAPRGGAEKQRRPLHLICCTANNLTGDVLASLYRGGRSAVLSPHGIALGDYAAELDELRLSSALTASAAAFNSQMGRFSMDYGPAVGFLMSALNLRLGLWVPHPLNPNRGQRKLRGLAFFQEMFGRTNCDVAAVLNAPPPSATAAPRPPAPKGFQNLVHQVQKTEDFVHRQWQHVYREYCDLHLSDGGHFENFGLYELVRRHCRYIIVSDCGADPEVAFDDLAIALRTVREDFGVEIDLDVSPLRRGENGRARQHAVVGTIHYDGPSGLDKGTIVYFKPTLTGDEPPDVLQYQTRNLAFPHESTGDQFYDEAQWESYRRLGQHAATVVFGFINPKDEARRENQGSRVENAFLEATRQWHPAPERQTDAFLALTERCSQLEADIRENAPDAVRLEFFPEVVAANPPKAASTPPPAEDVRTLYFLMQVAQLMEDVWIGADLDKYWSHPMNDGWMNYCHRWASTPSFRRWWPVLRPIYSIGFRDFVKTQFDLRYDDSKSATSSGARLRLTETTTREGLAWDCWRGRRGEFTGVEDKRIVEFRLSLDPLTTAPGMREFPVGILFYNVNENGTAFEWQNEHLFVPPSLNGAGITARFLEAIIKHLAPARLEVVFKQGSRTDRASRLRQLHSVNFYKSRGFVSEHPTENGIMRLARPGAHPKPRTEVGGGAGAASAAQGGHPLDPVIGPKLAAIAAQNAAEAVSPAAAQRPIKAEGTS